VTFRRHPSAALAAVIVLALASTGRAQQEPAGRGRGRATPPQPQQKQGVEYLLGSWTFTWTGRESPLTAGPRTGTITFTRKGTANGLEIRTEGTRRQRREVQGKRERGVGRR
jgi:hypothetical protein